MTTTNAPDTSKALRLALAGKKMKQRELAVMVGLSARQISNLAQGYQVIQGDTLNRIAAAFGMKSSEFLALGED